VVISSINLGCYDPAAKTLRILGTAIALSMEKSDTQDLWR